jgi:hypothetical protein
LWLRLLTAFVVCCYIFKLPQNNNNNNNRFLDDASSFVNEKILICFKQANQPTAVVLAGRQEGFSPLQNKREPTSFTGIFNLFTEDEEQKQLTPFPPKNEAPRQANIITWRQGICKNSCTYVAPA